MPSWDDLRVFLAVAREGTLSRAARVLEISQPTVGRRLAALEAELGTRLFDRTFAGFELTAGGRVVERHALEMEASARAIERGATGLDVEVAGVVRVSAPDWLVVRVLAAALAELGQRHDALTVELIAETRWARLDHREADVAVRMSPFEGSEVVRRTIADVRFAVYASREYLERVGSPDPSNRCAGARVLLMAGEHERNGDLEWFENAAGAATVAMRANARETLARAAVAGLGLTCLPRFVGDATAELVPVGGLPAPPTRRLSVGLHGDARRTPRVRAVFDAVVSASAAIASRL